jgi:DNA/RNA endonuclease YhcR with UshA esterase domain
MKRRLFTLLCVSVLGSFAAKAQTYKLVTIKDIQYVSNSDLSNCSDASPLLNDTVRVRGVVVTNGGLSQASAGVRNIWIQDGTGSWAGLDIFLSGGKATSPVDINNLVQGDSIEVTGVVSEYQGETEVMPLIGSGINSVKLLGSNRKVHATVVNVSDLNDSKNNNQLTTGEPFEGDFITIKNVTVSTVDPFSNNTRYSFHVVDASGNSINISDRFLAGRLATTSPGGTFVIPNIGDAYTSISGILMHSKNNCPGATGRGYELHPFDSSQYKSGVTAPSITNVKRDLQTPKSTQSVTISADVSGHRGVKSVTLYYAVGATNNSYTSVAMISSGGTSTYTATVPAQQDGSFVKYYISATDTAKFNPLTGSYPNISVKSIYPLFYRVRDNGLSIFDVQYTPFASATSGYAGQDVTVSGVVTAANSDVGATFIQQPGQLAWAGIMATGSTALNTLKVGDMVTLTGTVSETNGLTQLTAVSSVTKTGTGKITPIAIADTTFSTYKFSSNEAYEDMLVTIVPSSGKKLFIVTDNADSAAGKTTNFGEYRVGTDTSNTTSGTRVLAGIQGGSNYGSLNVSYINSFIRTSGDGMLNVPQRTIHKGDNMDSVRGVIIYTFSNMKLLPRTNADFFNINNPVNTDTTHHSSVAEISNKGIDVQMYPNPSNGQLTVNVNNSDNARGVLKITDMMGRTVYTDNIQSGNAHYELNLDVPAGNYILTIILPSEGLSKQTKLLIVK